MCMARNDIDFTRFANMLKRNGFVMIRAKGSHYIYKDDNGREVVVNIKLGRKLAKKIVKENMLDVSGYPLLSSL